MTGLMGCRTSIPGAISRHDLVQLLQNQELALSLSQESRKKIMAKFSHGLRAETLAQCLENLNN